MKNGNKVSMGCVIYLFCMMGFTAMYMGGYSLFPETYGVDVATVSTSLSACALFGFLSSFAYTTVNNKIHAKGMLYLGAALALAAAACLCFLSGFIGLVVAFTVFGFVNGFATYTVITEILSNWFVEKRADKIALSIAGGAFGMAAYQFVAGQVFNAIGLRKGFLFIGIFNFVVLTCVTKFLVVADDPKKIGDKPFGEAQVPAAPVQETEQAPVGNASNLYKNPTFWLGCLARITGAAGVMFVSTYATMYFGMGGMSLSMSATIVSVMTFGSAIFSLFSGKILGFLKVEKFMIFVLILAALSNAAMLIYGASPSVVVLLMIILCYSVGNAVGSLNNLVIDKMFKPEDINNANSKLYGILYAGNIVYLPLSGIIIENMGYNVLWILMTAVNVISLIFYLAALKVAKKQGI